MTEVTITSAYTVASSDNGTTLILSGNALFTLTFGAPTGYASEHVNLIANTDTVRAKKVTFASGDWFFLWPQQMATVRKVGAMWLVDRPGRWDWKAGVNIYVDPAGNDANDGMAPLSASTNGPVKTFARAYQLLQREIDAHDYLPYIRAASGTYTGGLSAVGGITGAMQAYVIGDVSNPANCVISPPTAANCFETADKAFITVQGFRVQGPAGTNGLKCWKQSGLDFAFMDFGTMTGGSHISCALGGEVIAVGDYSISGDAYYHIGAVQGGRVKVSGVNCNIPAARSFNTFASSQSGGLIDGPSIYTGAGAPAVTGVRADARLNGVVYVNGNPFSYPGTSANTSSTGGQIL